jgi:predicted secreted Zn-dependent protease
VAVVRRGRAAGLALALGLSFVAFGCSSPAPKPPVIINTATSTQYYSVQGMSAIAIFDEIDRTNLVEKSGQRAIGLTAADWKLSSDGPCNAPALTVSLTLVVTLPRHEMPDALRGDVRRHWDLFAARVAAHEQRHVDIFLEGAKALKGSMDAALAKAVSCADVEKAAEAVWKSEQAAVERAQEKFHVEDTAKNQAERGPLQSQLDGNRTRLATLEAELKRPGVTGEQHNTLATEYNRLVAESNDLVEALNWIR